MYMYFKTTNNVRLAIVSSKHHSKRSVNAMACRIWVCEMKLVTKMAQCSQLSIFDYETKIQFCITFNNHEAAHAHHSLMHVCISHTHTHVNRPLPPTKCICKHVLRLYVTIMSLISKSPLKCYEVSMYQNCDFLTHTHSNGWLFCVNLLDYTVYGCWI